MINLERHPLVRNDLREIVRHVAKISGDKEAAVRRLDEIEALLAEILLSPSSGSFLNDTSSHWRVRHGGRGRMITIVFRLSDDGLRVQVPIVAFGGQDWMTRSLERQGYFDRR